MSKDLHIFRFFLNYVEQSWAMCQTILMTIAIVVHVQFLNSSHIQTFIIGPTPPSIITVSLITMNYYFKLQYVAIK